MNYEDAVKRLKTILKTLEDDEIPVSESLKLYEEALGLSKICVTEMKRYKVKLTELSKEFSNFVETEIDGIIDGEE